MGTRLCHFTAVASARQIDNEGFQCRDGTGCVYFARAGVPRWGSKGPAAVEVSLEDDDLAQCHKISGGVGGEPYDYFLVPVNLANRTPRHIHEDIDGYLQITASHQSSLRIGRGIAQAVLEQLRDVHCVGAQPGYVDKAIAVDVPLEVGAQVDAGARGDVVY
jgi:hypothetical protein